MLDIRPLIDYDSISLEESRYLDNTYNNYISNTYLEYIEYLDILDTEKDLELDYEY